jgi:hypothetical protein
MTRLVAAAFSVLLLCGCTSQAEKTMGGGEAFFYPELETFDQEGLFSVGYPASKGNWVEARKAGKNPNFAKAIATFEASNLPSGFDDRKPAKDEVVAAAKAFHEKAKGSGPNDEVEKAYETLKEALKKLRGVTEPVPAA